METVLTPKQNENRKWGFIDKAGNEVIPLIYDSVEWEFSEGLAIVEKDGKEFYINKKGEYVLAGRKANALDTDNSTSYVDLRDYVDTHQAQVIPKDKAGEVLPWVHIAISSAERLLINTFHDIKPEYLQKYLDEFCYKFNRRYHGELLFNRLLVASVSYKNYFRYKYG